MTEVREYIDQNDRSHFREWFDNADATVAAKITKAVQKLSAGHVGNTKSVGEGVSEYKIDYGPGYRVYYGKDGDSLVLLLTGGNKKSQRNDIAEAKRLWKEYKRRKRELEKAKVERDKKGTRHGTHKRI
ncbi:type II toxin-antitoxin system RelE/ParE family toxin [Aporhodopirellula aestuarii]|uniref:Type II toxin-antitoxin system RelE/ParE family toxin n=1 Tax=Aporhodopirellula aestuarii TaxID=2950107 RepID=A0ABT0U9D1_9BACT|nr:type II toxin-antitoxin system RelE/ParE family toxin [Aporhodopirellula aestuarii]MCM2373412.1 type II toxin-antitoxin system RelE/ParE family toxin [Aporhodopirellula aestuarii]